jgi:glycosyl transferase family 2
VPEICFVLARGQNSFFFELAEAVSDELELVGWTATISMDGFPEPRDDLVYALVAPHEYYWLEGVQTEPTWQTLKRTIFICAEQPGTSFFDNDVFLAERAGGVFDISRASAAEFARRGVEGVRHFPLGWTRRWSPVDFDQETEDAERDIDLLHLGVYSRERAHTLAAASTFHWHRRTALILADDDRPNSENKANFVTGTPKWELLERARVLLNLHVSERPYFEWLRIVQAIGSGCAVVSQHSLDYEPLVPGEHILFGRPAAVGLLAGELLDDEPMRFELAERAWRFLKEELPLANAVRRLADVATEVARNPLPADKRTVRFRMPLAPPVADPAPLCRYPSDVTDKAESVLRAAAKDIRLDLLAMKRRAARAEWQEQHGTPPPAVLREAETSAWADAAPEVSFVVALFNHADTVGPALRSAAASRNVDIEIIVVDDASSDGSGQAVQEWMAEADDIPALLLRHPVNRGPGASRNTAVESARGEFVFVLDSDNEVFPTALEKLLSALDDEPRAAFAYGILAAFSAGRPVGLRNHFPWQPDRLRRENPIDAMALIRRSWLLENGGYTTDLRLHGWEDYDLWCRVAELRGFGVMVPEIVARYRSSDHSMLTLTDISIREATALLIDRYPELMGGLAPAL